KLFADFVERERLPRLVQEARARLKRNAENAALQQAWSQLESALDRGRHEGAVLGACALRGGKLMLALLDNESRMLRSASLPARADDLPARVAELLGDDKPDLLAMQADSASRAAATKLQEALRAAGCKFRQALVPVAVVKTMLREVARRPDETHLSHDERQALLLARLAWSPRDAAFHTPHVVRAYIPFRGEINGRRLEQFERTFLQYLLGERGVDINEGSRDRLRLVPGLDVETVELERSTAPFRSLADLQARLGLTEPAWNAACCLLRVRNGDEQLDGRPLHPRYYEALQEALERTNLARTAAGEAALSIAEIMREPAKAAELDWEPSLEARGWRQAVVDHVRSRLGRPSRRPRPRRQTGRPANTGQRLETLEIGAKLPGKITSLVAYGAFVDVGVRREGLVHVSQMADRFVKDPADVVKVGQEVIARVVSVDVENQRFRLSLRSEEAELAAAAERSGGGGGGERGGGERGGGERGSGERGSGRGGRGGGRGDERGGERRSTNPAVRDTRPKGGRAGGKGRGDDRGKREKDIVVGRDPRGRTVEEIDPTNPFVQFFREHSDVLGGGAAKGGKKSGGKEKDASS
ncbi:MAG TPA: S1 RNA-binding domain-containing protein, partial [Planctomycetota bacterium]